MTAVESSRAVDRLRRYAASHRAWTRGDVLAAIGPACGSCLSALVARGEIVSPGRGVYALPGVHDEDPTLTAALARAGSYLYPKERRIASMLPVERRAMSDLRSAGERTQLRDSVIAYMATKRVATTTEVREALGSAGASKLAELTDQGVLQRIATGVYAGADVDPSEPEVDAALSAQSAVESRIVSDIDAAVASHMATSERIPAELAGKATLRYWEAGALPTGRPPIRRVYIEIPNYPIIFGQNSNRKVDGQGGSITWGSSSPRLGPVQAQALARKVFDPVPTHFHQLVALIPSEGEATVALTVRNDAHSNLDPQDDPAPVTIDERHPLPCAYVVKDTSSLDPARLQHPLPEKVRLLVDHREPASIITALRRVENLEVLRTELPVGDYMVEGRIVIERKSNDDFHASLKEGANHLMKQVERMAETGLHRVLIVEGGLYARRQFILNRLVSTESYIQHVHGIHIKPTMNRQHSIYAIVQAIKHTIFGMFSDVHGPDPLDKREIASDPSRTVRMLLSHLQGVSEERVNALCEHFGTFAAIVAADVEHLREVKGIGPKTAAQIHDVFHHRIAAATR